MKFKVGDKVRGTSDSYSVANRSMTLAEVVGVIERPDRKYGHMDIKVIEHTDKTKIGQVYIAYNLDTDFELVEEKEMDKLEELEKQVELYEKNIESQQQSLETLKRELEELKMKKENEPWKPKDGDKYWLISHNGYVVQVRWMGDEAEDDIYAIGNVFKTREEAEFRIEQLTVEAELRRFARPFDRDEENWVINYDVDDNAIIVFRYHTVQCVNIHFASKEIAQKAIDTVGADRIKKYYFGVED